MLFELRIRIKIFQNAEYAAKARAVDRQFCGSGEGEIGPVEQQLRSFEPVRGLVFGAWGECSRTVSKLLTCFATAGAHRHWRGMRHADAFSAAGTLAWLLRRRWALTAMRENARLKLDRLEHVGRGAVAAANRRASAWEAHNARLRATAGSLMSGPRATVGRTP